MASSGSWADFEGHKNSIRHNTVAKLQSIISGWSEQCRASIPKSGKKQDLIDRMTRAMDDWRENNQLDKWLRAKAVIEQVREKGYYSHFAMPSDLTSAYNPNPTFSPMSGSHKINGNSSYPLPLGSGSSHLRYDAYAPPRKAAPSAPSATSSPAKPSIRFKSSPFYRIEHPVSPVVECPESTSAMDRRSQSLTFTLTSEQVGKLQGPNSKHQLRLFCTSSTYHIHHNTGFRTEAPCPIEFPATCEVRVNNMPLNANLKGLKKRPGTAPPPDLGKVIRLTTQMPNRVDMVYVNSQQPVQQKKFYMVVYLVEFTTVQQLVDKLKKGKYRNESDIRAKIMQSVAYDEDIIAGPQKMSLKCPLSYLRIDTPCRSIQCPHAQCFDATSWYSMMEQTTTWLCPVCDKVLNTEDLIIDGYFDQILKETPESVEDVMVEADGEWHTSDNKYASAAWRASHPYTNGSSFHKSASPRKEPEKPIASSSTPNKSANSQPPQEVISLDSDSDDEGFVKKELSPMGGYTPSQSQSFGSGGSRSGLPPSANTIPSTTEIIDLTSISDEEDDTPPAPPPKPTQKRKERESDTTPEVPAVWKKARYSGPSGSSSGGYAEDIRRTVSPGGGGLNGPSYPSSGVSGSGGVNGWGPVRIPASAPSQSVYQTPFSHTSPLPTGMPAHSQNMNALYANYTSNLPHAMNMTMAHPPMPAPSSSYRGGGYGYPSAPS